MDLDPMWPQSKDECSQDSCLISALLANWRYHDAESDAADNKVLDANGGEFKGSEMAHHALSDEAEGELEDRGENGGARDRSSSSTSTAAFLLAPLLPSCSGAFLRALTSAAPHSGLVSYTPTYNGSQESSMWPRLMCYALGSEFAHILKWAWMTLVSHCYIRKKLQQSSATNTESSYRSYSNLRHLHKAELNNFHALLEKAGLIPTMSEQEVDIIRIDSNCVAIDIEMDCDLRVVTVVTCHATQASGVDTESCFVFPSDMMRSGVSNRLNYGYL
ncbi:hypothetical protein Sjap_017643 [Stephania japonica]|uniref:Uncharacterized protein n=1 Tax=Stephania japonica TaxID=461633 RepID=A0AAP0NJP8_9MAGN